MSSAETRLPLAVAQEAAATVVDLLQDACTRIVVAGSIRRQAPDVGDIEIVCLPRMAEVDDGGLFGDTLVTVDLLDERVRSMIEAGTFAHRLDKNLRKAAGSRYRRLLFRDPRWPEMALDLFSPVPEGFGAVLAIRTGPAALSHQLVTPKGQYTSDGQRGLMPAWLQMKGGVLRERVSGEVIATPTEEDFFEAIGLPWVEPSERGAAPRQASVAEGSGG